MTHLPHILKKLPRTALAIFIAASLIGAAAFSPQTTASLSWKWFHVSRLALFLSDDAQFLFEIGNYYFGEGAYDLALTQRFFARALIVDPNLLGPRYQLARIYFLQNDFITAARFADEELALHPDFKRTHYVRGLIYGYSGRLTAAVLEFQAFLKWDPRSWAAYNDLAWIYFQQGKFTAAAEAAQKGLQLAPSNPWLLTMYGTALLNLGNKPDAQAILAQALLEAGKLSHSEWGKAYPGNNPAIYAQGLANMRNTIQQNLELTKQ